MNRFWIRQSLLISLIMLLVIFPIGFGVRYFVVQSVGINEVHDEENELAQVGGVILFSALIGLSVGVIGSRRLSTPINRLVEGVRRIEAVGPGYQLKLERSSSEFQELTTAINAMSSELQRAEMQRRRLLADVSHELRTPLTVLDGHLRAALDGVYSLDEAQIASLYVQIQHLIRLVEDLNLLAMAETNRLSLNLEQVDITAVAREVVDNFRLMAESTGIALRLNAAEDLLRIRADVVRCRQILSNLIDNALQYTPAQGAVDVTISADELAVQIVVSDTGSGIDAAHLPFVFDRFYRADASRSRSSGGTGLGLAIVKALVETQGGSIAAHSRGSQMGTTFVISFPGNLAFAQAGAGARSAQISSTGTV